MRLSVYCSLRTLACRGLSSLGDDLQDLRQNTAAYLIQVRDVQAIPIINGASSTEKDVGGQAVTPYAEGDVGCV